MKTLNLICKTNEIDSLNINLRLFCPGMGKFFHKEIFLFGDTFKFGHLKVSVVYLCQ